MRGQSSCSRRPERIAPWLMRPRDDSIRMTMESAGISMENTSTGLWALRAAFSHRFMAKVVLPMEGRPATTTMSAGCRPPVILSSSSKPLVRPVRAFLFLYSSSMRSTAFLSTDLMFCGPSPFFCCSAISKIADSASSRISRDGLPLGWKDWSAMPWDTWISCRRMLRSRTMSA